MEKMIIKLQKLNIFKFKLLAFLLVIFLTSYKEKVNKLLANQINII